MPSLNLRAAPRDERGFLIVEPAPVPAPPTRTMADLLQPAPAAPAPAPPRASWRVQAATITIAAIVLLILVVALGRGTVVPRPAALNTTAPTLPATAAPAIAASGRSVAPTAAPGCTITRAAATFYAPAGDATGEALEAGTACQLVAWHAGFPDWRQIAAGGAPIWVRASVLSVADTAGLPDLAPPPTSTPAPATARPIVIIEQAPPAPTQCATVRGGGATVQRCGSAPLDQLQADAEAAWRAQMQPTTPGGE